MFKIFKFYKYCILMYLGPDKYDWDVYYDIWLVFSFGYYDLLFLAIKYTMLCNLKCLNNRIIVPQLMR